MHTHLDVLAELQVGEAVACRGPIRKVHHQHRVDLLAVLVEDDDVGVLPVGGELDDLLEREAGALVVLGAGEDLLEMWGRL